ncbi:MAG: hypothetical protein REI78_16080 [Pedobacter sp.]|nr:hypothetical protein [Pedobacter sp.]MDQ8054549.1 hypothetical protein [Pedobacter sp.]
MKKITKMNMVILMIVAIVIGAGCSNPIPVPTIESRIVGKWTMKTAVGHYVTQGVPLNQTTNFTATDYFDFRADGTLSIAETGKSYQGKWKVVGNKIIFSETNYIDYPNGFDIKILTANDFQIYYTETKQISSLEQWLNFAR